jgi:hypothetical protein
LDEARNVRLERLERIIRRSERVWKAWREPGKRWPGARAWMGYGMGGNYCIAGGLLLHFIDCFMPNTELHVQSAPYWRSRSMP